jgi:DNA repair exonuclease SbcCD ATPase subunit
MQRIPKSEVVTSSLVALKREREARYKVAQRDHAKAMKDVTELLSDLISGAESKLAEDVVMLNKAKRDLDECDNRIVEVQEQFDEVISWTELYDAADLAAKKMIVANLIDRIEVGLRILRPGWTPNPLSA